MSRLTIGQAMIFDEQHYGECGTYWKDGIKDFNKIKTLNIGDYVKAGGGVYGMVTFIGRYTIAIEECDTPPIEDCDTPIE